MGRCYLTRFEWSCSGIVECWCHLRASCCVELPRSCLPMSVRSFGTLMATMISSTLFDCVHCQRFFFPALDPDDIRTCSKSCAIPYPFPQAPSPYIPPIESTPCLRHCSIGTMTSIFGSMSTNSIPLPCSMERFYLHTLARLFLLIMERNIKSALSQRINPTVTISPATVCAESASSEGLRV